MTGSAVVLRDVMTPREGLAGAIVELRRHGSASLRRTRTTSGRRTRTHRVIASIDGDEVGITTVKYHSRYAAELF
jgi:hypothetical protein